MTKATRTGLATKPWAEAWHEEQGFVYFGTPGNARVDVCLERHDDDGGVPRARLAAAAPALVRALLRAEWQDYERRPGVVYAEGYDGRTCPTCGGRQWVDGSPVRHDDDCPIDAALTAAGLPTQQERDQARETIGGG